jgi:hypothetical protein
MTITEGDRIILTNNLYMIDLIGGLVRQILSLTLRPCLFMHTCKIFEGFWVAENG